MVDQIVPEVEFGHMQQGRYAFDVVEFVAT